MVAGVVVAEALTAHGDSAAAFSGAVLFDLFGSIFLFY